MNTRELPENWVHQFVGHIVIGLLCTLPEEEQAAFHKRNPPGPERGLEIKVTVGDTEFDFRKFAERCEQHLDYEVTKLAGEMLKEQTGDLMYKLQKSVDELVRGIRRQAAEKLGYNPWENDR